MRDRARRYALKVVLLIYTLVVRASQKYAQLTAARVVIEWFFKYAPQQVCVVENQYSNVWITSQ